MMQFTKAERYIREFFRKRKLKRQERSRFVEGWPPVLVRSVVFFGVLCVVTGIWCCSQSTMPIFFEGESIQYKYPAKLLLFTGSMLIAKGMVAIWAAGKELRVALTSLTQGLIIILILEAIAGASSFSLNTVLSAGALNASLLHDLKNEYSRNQRITLAWDKIQKSFQCCGLNNPLDWMSSAWKSGSRPDEQILPFSCCASNTGNIACRLLMSDLYNRGCGAPVSKAVHKRLTAMSRCAFICIAVHLTSFLALAYLEKRA